MCHSILQKTEAEKVRCMHTYTVMLQYSNVVDIKAVLLRVHKFFRSRRQHPIRQATPDGKDDTQRYHLPSVPVYPAVSRDTMSGPVYALTVELQTHVYDKQQSTAASQPATQVYSDNRTKAPAQQKTTTRNGMYILYCD